MTRMPPSTRHLPPRGLTAGEHALPGGGMRLLRAARSVFLWTGAIVALAIPIAAGLAYLRIDPAELPAALEAALDQRSDGEKAVAFAQQRLAAAPDDPRALAGLASAYLIRVRETADPSYYAKADALVLRATATPVTDADVAIVAGTLAAARHDFAAALDWAGAAVRIAPARPAAYGLATDALVELGRYEDAVTTAQHMIDLRPDLASYSRVSYLRELHGDPDGAIDAMRRAVAAAAPRSESAAWADVQLGNLLFARADLAGAKDAYESATHRQSDYALGVAGLARVRAAMGDLPGAAALYEGVAARYPAPDFVIALGDVYHAMGDDDRAERQYALVAAMERLLAANGVRTDVDLALFDADHGRNVASSLTAARSEYAVRPSVRVAEILAWTEYRSGDVASALAHSREATRLGTRDPLLLYRAGVIADAAGDGARAAALLRASAEASPRYSLLFAGDLAGRVRRLGATP